MNFARRLLLLPLLVALCLSLGGCAALEQIAALQRVDFSIARADAGLLAGIDLSRIRSARDLTPAQLLTLATAVRRDELPFAFTLHVAADNPAANAVDARLVELDWTLLLEGRETIGGSLSQGVLLPAGQTTEIPLRIELDLLRFYRDNYRDLAELALAVAGREGGVPKDVALRARPTVQTPIGPILYPGDITIASRRVGG